MRLFLTDPSRRTSPAGGGRKHLLSAGISRCGVCGDKMRASLGKAYKGNAKPIYRCEKACVTRDLVALEAFVTGLVYERLDRPDAVHLLRRDDTAAVTKARAAVELLRSRLDTAAGDYADGTITSEQMRTITARLRPRIAAAEKLVPTPPLQIQALGELVGGDTATIWETLDVSVQRQVVDELMSVTVHRTRHGHGAFDPAAIQIDWK